MMKLELKPCPFCGKSAKLVISEHENGDTTHWHKMLMYDETVKRLKNCATQAAPCLTCDMTDDGSCIETLMKQAADAIEELRADKAALNGKVTNLLEQIKDIGKFRWIPVTERLPKTIDGENISKEVYVTDGEEIAKACIMRDYDGVTSWTYAGIGKITHWCEQIPTPTPPKEE